jgi:hypothetical protein
MKTTGWPAPPLMQDESRDLFRWFASKPDARRLVRQACAAILAAKLLTGCATPERTVVEVPIAVPVACQVAEPLRPAMDSDSVPLDAAIDQLARALRAEIERREGYEGELRAALQACRTIGRP